MHRRHRSWTGGLRWLASDRHGRWLGLLLLLGSVTYFTLRDYQGHVGGVAELDGYYYYLYLRSLQVDGDLDFTNEYKDWGNPFKFDRTATGRARNIFGVGPAIMWSPFFVTTHLLARLGVALGQPLSLDGLSRFHQVGTFYGSLLFGWIAVVLCYLLARRLATPGSGRPDRPPPVALVAALGGALAGPLPYYCLTRASYSHATATFATSLLVLLWAGWRGALDRRRWCWIGAATGLVLLVRPACVPFALLPLLEALSALAPAWRRRDGAALLRAARDPLLGALVALLVFAPQLISWQLMYGSLLTVPQGPGFLWWSKPAWGETLFSPRNGLLTMAPLMLVALAGLVGAALRRGSVARPLLLVFFLFVYVNASVHDWWGWEFSARRFTSCLPIFVVGLVAALDWIARRLRRRAGRTAQRVTGAVVVGFVLFNLAWMHAFGRYSLRWYQLRSTQALYMSVTNSLVDKVYRRIGNPLSLPASLAFSIGKGGTPRRYDRLGGSYLLGEVNPATNPAGKPDLHAMVDLGSLRFRPNLDDAFGNPAERAGKRFVPLRAPTGAVFIPLNRPGALGLVIGARALHRDTRVELRFNGHPLGTHRLSTDWTRLTVTVPAEAIDRGINRLDLLHRLPPAATAAPARRIGSTGVISPVDVAVVSGGLRGGRFCEIWVGERLVSHNRKGINVAVIDRRSGRLLDSTGFDVHIHKALYDELGAYLQRFPRGSIVALGTRGDAAKSFVPRSRRAWARFGASADLSGTPDSGYAAIGVVGGAPGSALEVVGHRAHAWVGRKPPPWRELAHYSWIRLVDLGREPPR